ncbi:MAG: META domain-containing protein [Sporichthyaceae bacterium]
MRARVVSSLAAFALLAGCGAAEQDAAPVVQAGSPTPAVALERTEWQLVGVRQAGVTVPTRPNLDVTMVVEPSGRFLLHACNNVFGEVVLGASTAMFDGRSTTRRACSGAASEVDAAVRSALLGEVGWEIAGRLLSLSTLDQDVRLDFRVKDPAQPPVSAVLVATVPEMPLGCRIMAGVAESGERLYALAQTREDGPWRLVRSGPAAPGDAPILAPELQDAATGRQCTAGFAPGAAARVAYQARPDAPPVDLALHRVSGIATPVYTGILERTPSAEPGLIRVYDAGGRVLQVWSTLA